MGCSAVALPAARSSAHLILNPHFSSTLCTTMEPNLCVSVLQTPPAAFKQGTLIKCKAAFSEIDWKKKCTASTWSSFYLNIKVSLSELILLVCTCLTRTIFFHLVKTKEFRSFCKLTLPSLCCIFVDILATFLPVLIGLST